MKCLYEEDAFIKFSHAHTEGGREIEIEMNMVHMEHAIYIELSNAVYSFIVQFLSLCHGYVCSLCAGNYTGTTSYTFT